MEGAAKVQSFVTALDNQQLTPYTIDVTTDEDYHILQERLKGSLYLNDLVYQTNWFWEDSFTEEEPVSMLNRQDYVRKTMGLDLSVERLYQITMTMAASQSINGYTFAVCQKEVMISPAGIVVS